MAGKELKNPAINRILTDWLIFGSFICKPGAAQIGPKGADIVSNLNACCVSKNFLLFIRYLLIIPAVAFVQDPRPPYKDPHLSVDRRVEDLLSRMTVEEKIRQLDMYWGKEVAEMDGPNADGHEASAWSEQKTAASLGNGGAGSVHDLYPLSAGITNSIQRYAMEKTRLGIPVLFIEEGLHGYSGLGSTSFPIPLQLSGAWDTALLYDVGRAIATETRAYGVDMLLAPVLCLPRDPRWGRTEETYGEDTWLDARNAVAMVKGLQGNGVDRPDAVISEPKHFAVHGIPEAGSNTAPVNMGEREARSSFLPVFEAAVREGGALSMMAAYSELDGIPCVDNKWLLTDVLRREWGFKGFVLSDLGAIKMSMETHHVAASAPDALAQALKAGLNMQFYDWPHAEFMQAMKTALGRGLLTTEQLNRAVRDILRVKFLLGLFDHPYTDTTLGARVLHTPAHEALALKAAAESICLLKNEGGILPLRGDVHNLAVIGPLAVSTYPGGYSNPQSKAVSILDGLRRRAGSSLSIRYEQGYSADSAGPDLMSAAIDAVNKADVAIVVLGEEPAIVGEGKDRAHLELSEQQLQLVKAVRETGKPVVVLLCNGRPLCIDWVAAHIPAIVETWFSGEQGGVAIADVLLGRTNPSGKLPMTFPRSEGQIPLYYNHKPSSLHRYVDEKDTPLFPFGYGLSYTHFEYSDLKVTPATIPAGASADVAITVSNAGAVAGAEVAQLYVRELVSSVTTPQLALKGFGRVMLNPGESRILHFRLGPDQLALWNREMRRVVEPGEFDIMVGSSSTDIRLTGSLRVIPHQ
jgi:beta-glucosidase